MPDDQANTQPLADTPPMLDRAREWAFTTLERELHPGEEHIILQNTANEIADLRKFTDDPEHLNDPDDTSEWHEHRTVDARLLRWMLLDDLKHASLGESSTVAVFGAAFNEPIEISNISSRCGFVLRFCCLKKGLIGARSHLSGLQVIACNIKAFPFLTGTRVAFGLHLVGSTFDGEIALNASHFESRPDSEHSVAVSAAGATTKGEFIANCTPDRRCISDSPFLLSAIMVGSYVDFTGAKIACPNKTAVDLSGASVGGDVSFSESGRWHASVRGTVLLAKANVGGALFAIGARFRNPGERGWCLFAAGATFGNGVGVFSKPNRRAMLLGSVRLSGCTLGGECTMVGLVVVSRDRDATLDLQGSSISGALVLTEGETDRGPSLDSLDLGGSRVLGNARFEGLSATRVQATGLRCESQVMLRQVRIADVFWLNASVCTLPIIMSECGFGRLDMEDARLGGVLADSCSFENQLSLSRAEIAGSVELFTCSLTGQHAALFAGHANIGRNLYIGNGPSGRCVANGMISFWHSRIGGSATLCGGVLDGLKSHAIELANARVEGDLNIGSPGQKMLLRSTLSLRNARIGGSLMMRGTRLRPQQRCAVSAEGVQIEGNAHLDALAGRPFVAVGYINFARAKIKGSLVMRGAWLRAAGRHALHLTGATIGHSVQLSYASRRGRPAIPFDADGALELSHSNIGSNANLHGIRVRCPDASISAEPENDTVPKAAISFVRSSIGGALRLTPYPFGRTDGAYSRVVGPVDLRHLRVGRLADFPKGLPPDPDEPWRIDRYRSPRAKHHTGPSFAIDGLEYERIGDDIEDNVELRLAWLGYKNPEVGRFVPHGYEQFAKFKHREGFDGAAKQVAYAKHRQRLRFGDLSLTASVWQRVLWLVVGFGYRTERVLVWLLAVWAVGLSVMTVAESSGQIAPSAPVLFATRASDGMPHPFDLELLRREFPEYPSFDPALYALDTLIPLVELGQESTWHLTTQSSIGWLARAYEVVHILLGWFLSTLGVVGLSGVLKRD